METLNILVTGGGSPGIAGTIYSLRIGSEKVRIITTDCRSDAVGQYLSDKFYVIHHASDEAYKDDIMKIFRDEQIDVMIPQNTAELNILNQMDLPAAVNRNISKTDLPYDHIINSKNKLMSVMNSYEKFVIKPLNSNGGRGVRIVIDDKLDYMRKPGTIIQNKRQFAYEDIEFPVLLMPYHEGKEMTVDCFRWRNDFIAIPRIREEVRSGITFNTKLLYDEYLIGQCQKLAREWDLKYCFGFQFIDRYLIDCNPRVQGTMVTSTIAGANLIWASVCAVIGIKIPTFEVNWNTRFIRYWGGIGISGEIVRI